MSNAQREKIRAALTPVLRDIFHDMVPDPRPPGEDEDFSGIEALFENIALGVKGVADDIVRDYEEAYRKGQKSIRVG